MERPRWLAPTLCWLAVITMFVFADNFDDRAVLAMKEAEEARADLELTINYIAELERKNNACELKKEVDFAEGATAMGAISVHIQELTKIVPCKIENEKVIARAEATAGLPPGWVDDNLFEGEAKAMAALKSISKRRALAVLRIVDQMKDCSELD